MFFKMRGRPKKFFLFGLIIFCLFFQVEILEGTDQSGHLANAYKDYNIILIFIDALRTDHLGCYGYKRSTSPNIDKLAKESIVFDNNFTPHTVTIASFMSIITSLYPSSHGVVHIMKDKLSPRIRTLAQILKVYNYKTGWFALSGDPHLDPEIGFGRGFDTIGDFPLGKGESLPGSLDIGRNTLFSWIEKNKNKNFFLNFHTYKVHDPYLPSTKYKEKFTQQKRKEIIESHSEYKTAIREAIEDALLERKGEIWNILGESLASKLSKKDFFKEGFSANKFLEIRRFFATKEEIHKLARIRKYVYTRNIDTKNIDHMKHIKSLYDAEILECDAKIIGPLVAKLKELNLYDRTIIIICADHGDEFGEHGKLFHGRTLYDEVVHVPLIVRVPWLKQGKRIQELTQTVDIMPTVLDLVGIPIPFHAQGKSLLSFINERNTSALREYVFGQLPFLSSIRSQEWKFILYKDGKRELFHLHSDPGEQRNLYTERQDIASKLESDLKKWEESLPSYKDKEYPFSPEVDEATQKRIKETGYW